MNFLSRFFVCGFVFLAKSYFISHAFELRTEGIFQYCNSTTPKNHTVREIVHTVENCKHKIRVTLTVKNQEKSPDDLQYTYVKEVLDVKSKIKLRLLNPLLIRFRQEQVLLGYPIKYLTAVNAKAWEEVVNYENRKNFTGCDDESPVNPTCGVKHHGGSAVEYSQGFCCFCPDVPAKGKQARGGQDCSLAKSPSPEIDLAAYKASAHCLNKNILWYTVNALDEPIILHQTFVQVYNLRHLTNGSSVWIALTGEEDFTIGPHNPFQYDENKTIVLTYVTEKPSNGSITIAFKKNRLLVPQPLFGVSQPDIPPASKNGPGDYLLIPKDVIHSEGDVCDKAGVSYEGFSLQTDRCDSARNSCLKNQPLDFWEKDNELRKKGGKGLYLLENFGKPYKDPIVINKETKEHWLALEYYKPHENFIYVETKADDIVALTIGKHGTILSVITECSPKYILFHVNIQNAGLASAEYAVKATECGYSVPDSNSQSKVIAAQLNTFFLVQTKPGDIQLTEEFTCVIELNSTLYKTIAKREVTIKPKGRCVCNFHCSCVCLGEKLICDPMEEEDYHLAGFRGSVPILTAKPPYKPWVVRYPFAAFSVFILVLLLFGFIKASFGLVGYSFIGEYGLHNKLYKRRKLEKYSDPIIADVEVIYDEEGYPIHPDTREKIKTFTPLWLFTLNVFFCFVWPVKTCKDLMSKQHSHYDDVTVDDKGEDEEGTYEPSQTASGMVSEGDTSVLFSIDDEKDSLVHVGKGEEATVVELTGSSDALENPEPEVIDDDDDDDPIKFKKKVDKVKRII